MICYVVKTRHLSLCPICAAFFRDAFRVPNFESVTETSGCTDVKNGEYNEELRDCLHIAYASFGEVVIK
jgi:hypothetical protein